MIRFTEKEQPPASLTSRRQALGMSVDELAKSAGVTVGVLNAIESPSPNGRTNAAAVAKVEKALIAAEGLKGDTA